MPDSPLTARPPEEARIKRVAYWLWTQFGYDLLGENPRGAWMMVSERDRKPWQSYARALLDVVDGP